VIDVAHVVGFLFACHARAKADVVTHGHPFKQRTRLKHHAAFGIRAVDLLAIQGQRPTGLRQKSGHNIQQRRFPAAGWTQHAQKLTGF